MSIFNMDNFHTPHGNCPYQFAEWQNVSIAFKKMIFPTKTHEGCTKKDISNDNSSCLTSCVFVGEFLLLKAIYCGKRNDDGLEGRGEMSARAALTSSRFICRFTWLTDAVPIPAVLI